MGAEVAAAAVRAVHAADYVALARFLAGFAGETRTSESWLRRFRLWWDDNPAFAAGLPRGWMICEGTRIGGFLGNVPSTMMLSGRPAVVFGTTTWRVEPAYRTQSLRLLFEALAEGRQSVLFNTTPTDDVVAIMKATKFQKVPTAIPPRNSMMFVNYLAALTPRFGRWAALAGVPALKALQYFRLRRVFAAPLDPVQQIERADARFDELWERTKGFYANTNVRSAAAVNWACFSHPEFRKLVWAYTDDRVRGYAVFLPGQSALNCVDLWLDGSRGVLEALLHAAHRYATAMSLDRVIVPHFNEQLGARLRSLSLFETSAEGDGRAYYYRPSPEVAAQIGRENSYFVRLQGDYGL